MNKLLVIKKQTNCSLIYNLLPVGVARNIAYKCPKYNLYTILNLRDGGTFLKI